MTGAGKQRLLERSWQQVELPVLDETSCTGCAWCVQVCPTECLEMGDHTPWMPRPIDCVSCELCVIICPASALSMST